jgi:hypothetical protein
MSRPIPATRLCAAPCSRIDLRPSRRAAALWLAWLAAACAVILFGVALPWLVRIGLCGALAIPGLLCVRSFVLLEGMRAVRAIDWSDGEFTIRLGSELTPRSAKVGAGSFRFGLHVWILRFETAHGPCPVLIAAGDQDARAFRRLCRCLNAELRSASGRSHRPTVTIRPKV